MRSCFLLLILALAGCATTSREPANLLPLKQQIRTYVASGDYDREIAIVAARAKAWVEERAARGGAKLTVVFDLDETLLRNWPYLNEVDFGYIHARWHQWVDEARAPAIEPVREVYRAARRLGIDVVFITGRNERDRPGTEQNLRAIECADYAALVMKPAEPKRTTGEFKVAARRRFAEEGRAIIANLGDQQSDLAGGYAERTFKLPNPFYLTE